MSDTGNSKLPEDQEDNLDADLEAAADEILKADAEAAELEDSQTEDDIAESTSEDTAEDTPEDTAEDTADGEDSLRSFTDALDGTGLDDESVSKMLLDNILGDREKLEEEVAELKDKLLRAMAEEQNLRRRMARELEDTSKYATTNFARDLLAVADNLKRALDHMDEAGSDESATAEDAATFRSGVELTARELENAFDKHGIKTVEPLGEKFDHSLHQAIFELPDSGEPDGTIVQVIAAGYTIGDRLLRAAMVGVAKGGNPAAEPEDKSSDEE